MIILTFVTDIKWMAPILSLFTIFRLENMWEITNSLKAVVIN